MSKFVSVERRRFVFIVEVILLPEKNGGMIDGRHPSAYLSRTGEPIEYSWSIDGTKKTKVKSYNRFI